jgi:hypothetical protein
MRLTIEVLDQKTLNWNVLACHEGVGVDAAPAIVAVLRDGLPEVTSLRWNWSRLRPQSPDGAPAPAPVGRGCRKRGVRR